jgi:hypothetical protein
MNVGIINSITRSHLVVYLSKVNLCILEIIDTNILRHHRESLTYIPYIHIFHTSTYSINPHIPYIHILYN